MGAQVLTQRLTRERGEAGYPGGSERFWSSFFFFSLSLYPSFPAFPAFFFPHLLPQLLLICSPEGSDRAARQTVTGETLSHLQRLRGQAKKKKKKKKNNRHSGCSEIVICATLLLCERSFVITA
ncbi:hypothetical protein QG37_01409 [Candidozyma auris]|nr:hypothetical protein QG37_01409 [[Candida] auris]